jgi:UPF0716 protein FxsA
MLVYLFLLFTLVPLIELALLIWIGGKTVWWLPIALVVLTAVGGAALARWQGWQVGTRIRGELRSGRLPAGAMLDGFLILVAAILLISPGVITDVLGILLLLPPVRAGVKRALFSQLRRQVQVKKAEFNSAVSARRNAAQPNATARDTVIDAKVISTRVEDAT